MRLLSLFAILSACTSEDTGKPADSEDDSSNVPTDGDGDGYALDQDCDDANADVHPGADETCNDIDDDCDGSVDIGASDGTTYFLDEDGDGAGTGEGVAACAAPDGFAATDGDCDDTNPAYHPGADESDCTDPNDYDCNGSVAYADADADGVPACEDCDDASPLVHPGAAERCDGLDNDCNDVIDDTALDASLWYADVDADGYGAGVAVSACDAPEGYVSTGDDCNDADAAFHPAASEDDCTDPNDYNCDGSVGYDDADADGFPACDDCDDAALAVNRDAIEVCDGVDNDCDATVDVSASDAGTYYADVDTDGYGDVTATIADCSAPTGYVADATDCDDGNATIHPGADESDCTDATDYNCDGSVAYEDADTDGFPACEDCNDADPAVSPSAIEVCDGVDNDCNGANDEDTASDAATWYADADADGYGYASATDTACEQPAGYIADSTDCDDADALSHPGGSEVCGGGDEDCDGSVDEGDAVGAVIWYADADADGFGDGGVTVSACDIPTGYTSDTTDCDDLDPAINPAAAELCDFNDNNCDGAVDEASAVDALVWYADADADTYGDAGVQLVSCDQPEGYVAEATDCNDLVATTNPAGTEVCGGEDEDCDGETDDAGAVGESPWYSDLDGDAYGNPLASVVQCSQPPNYVLDATDCDDAVATTNPAASEACGGGDENCDGAVDEDGATGELTFYLDSDGDVYGGTTTALGCSAPTGYVATSGDCDDDNDAINPGLPEICDAADTDENCDGSADDATAAGQTYWYTDADEDGFGGTTATLACDAPSGTVATSTDCDDSNSAINPAATEVCDAANTDEDCDGTADDASATGQSTWYLDSDHDGYSGSFSITACDAPAHYLATSTDCDDTSAAVNPAAIEVCDGSDTDENCDGQADDATATGQTTWYADVDGDGYGSSTSTIACNQPANAVLNHTDCDDGDAAINPAAVEVCDTANTDEDCNGEADDFDSGSALATMTTWYADADEDGFGDISSTDVTCDVPTGFVTNSSDCNDADEAINPDATEICEGANVDEDCDTLVNDDDPSIDDELLSNWYADDDADAYGDAADVTRQCAQPIGTVLDNTDCNDAAYAINPGVPEICDAANTDENCNDAADDLDAGATGKTTWYLDADSDAYGISGGSDLARCDQPSGYSSDATDCDDTAATSYPGASEVCQDGLDNGCDGADDCRDDGLYGVAATGTVDVTYDGLNGSTATGFLGAAMSGGRDFNGDTYPDVAIGNRAWDVSSTSSNQGRAYLMAGTAAGLPSALSSSFATYTGAGEGDAAGQGLSLMDDVDADGRDELLVGTYLLENGSVTNAGAVTLIRGNTTGGAYVPTSATLTLKGTASNENLGWCVGDAGDFDNDGIEDWYAGAYRYTSGTSTGLGRLIVMPGDHATGTWTMSTATPITIISGFAAGDRLGYAAVGRIDTGGDGFDDLVVGATGTDAVYIFEGPLSSSSVTTLTRADADYTIADADAYLDASNIAGASQSLSSAGDTNSDGYEDLLVGADGWDGGGALIDVGAAFLFPGPISASVASTSATGQIRGSVALDFLGRSTAGVGDVDGDGHDDVLIGGSGYDSPVSGGGVAVLMYGPFVGTYTIAGGDAVYRASVASGALGTAVTALGDSNLDGFDDFMFGAPNATNGTSIQGRVYAVYGTGQ